MGKSYVVTYDLVSETNIHDLAPDIRVHDHEEADTLLILHCYDVARHDPFAECVAMRVFIKLVRKRYHHF